MSSEMAIKVENVSKCYEIYATPGDRLKQFLLPRLHKLFAHDSKSYYQEFWALRDVSFEVKKGSTVGIIGRNGCGKSTLLQAICGTVVPTRGSISANGRIAALLELGSGFNPEFTGRENVHLSAAVLGLSQIQIDQRFNDIVAFADIGDFVEQPVKTYSSGMLLRLAFAVIAFVDADILIIDEALSVGDAYFTQKCMRFLRNFMKTGTLLFVSHDTSAIINLCDTAVYLDAGRVVKIGQPKEIANLYLADFYEKNQTIDGVLREEVVSVSHAIASRIQYRDMREDFINASSLRNDIEVFKFDSTAAGFGTGEAEIIAVTILDQSGNPLSWIVGGEDVILEVRCRACNRISSPIVGFEFRDRLGQIVFADNTFIVYQDRPQKVERGFELVARFEFRLPVLPAGDYSISAAVANGTQTDHVQLHWLYDALIVRAHASSVCFGLLGIPMKSISLEAI